MWYMESLINTGSCVNVIDDTLDIINITGSYVDVTYNNHD